MNADKTIIRPVSQLLLRVSENQMAGRTLTVKGPYFARRWFKQ
jgi:hypothetical protein